MKQQNDDVILLAHGDGGALTSELIDNLFQKYFTSDFIRSQTDAAIFKANSKRLALTTDSFVVNPLFFPGGDIGKLAVCGTVNDLAVSGAHPVYLAASFIIEEGFERTMLEKVVSSMAASCNEAGVEIVAGDTKVVERDHLDKLFITTTGVGWVSPEIDMGYHRILPGDLIVVNGNLGEHGIAVMGQRHGFDFDNQIISDCAPLNIIIKNLLQQCSGGVKLMRDLTRGGFATATKEIAMSSGRDVWLKEDHMPIAPVVQGAARMLGLDPLYLANEGKFLMIVDPKEADTILEILHHDSLGVNAQIVGEVKIGNGNVYLETMLGGTKFLDLMTGSPLPRIC